jgi:Zn-finger nucleic acid-binding protein
MTPDARALHCPNCGGPVAPGDAACKYCRAALATVSCPTCFALMFEGAIYCPACGTRRARPHTGELRAPCPACRGTMRDVRIGVTRMLECAACHGQWVDGATFEQICADREAQAAAALHQSPAASRPQVAAPVRYRKCVACGKMMNRVNFGRLSGTVIDICRGHGTFLDAGELHAIVTFITEGGLDRARQREKDDLEEERHRLAMLKTHIEAAGRVSELERQSTLSDHILHIQRLLKGE